MPVAQIILLFVGANDVYFAVRANALMKKWHLYKKPLIILEEQRCILHGLPDLTTWSDCLLGHAEHEKKFFNWAFNVFM